MRRVWCVIWSAIAGSAFGRGTNNLDLGVACFLGLLLISFLLCSVVRGLEILIKSKREENIEPPHSSRSTGK